MSLRYPHAEQYVKTTISYFAQFDYPPTFNDLLTFFPEKISKRGLKAILAHLVNKKKLVTLSYPSKTIHNTSSRGISYKKLTDKINDLDCHSNLYNSFLNFEFCDLLSSVYTLPQYSMFLKKRLIRRDITNKKLYYSKYIISLLSICPFVKCIGITGSASMGNCKKNDDIDLCIITRKGCLFIARFCLILLVRLLSQRYKRKSSHMCLNLFFDESDLIVPHFKQTLYVAHEALQMKPIYNINHTYEQFLNHNKWIFQIFPNAPRYYVQDHKTSLLWDFVSMAIKPLEYILSKIQLSIIRKNRTGYYLTPTQLWLFKNDFEKKVIA